MMSKQQGNVFLYVHCVGLSTQWTDTGLTVYVSGHNINHQFSVKATETEVQLRDYGCFVFEFHQIWHRTVFTLLLSTKHQFNFPFGMNKAFLNPIELINSYDVKRKVLEHIDFKFLFASQ